MLRQFDPVIELLPITMVTIFQRFFSHVLSWVKSNNHAKFQRNLPTGLARMMVQTYRETNRHPVLYKNINKSELALYLGLTTPLPST